MPNISLLSKFHPLTCSDLIFFFHIILAKSKIVHNDAKRDTFHLVILIALTVAVLFVYKKKSPLFSFVMFYLQIITHSLIYLQKLDISLYPIFPLYFGY